MKIRHLFVFAIVKEGVLHLYNPTGSNRAFTIEKCSKNYMEWLYKFENWEDGVFLFC